MDGAMGKEEDVVEAVLTCEGDFHDPELHHQIERFRHKLKDLLLTDSKKLQVRKVEPWNSVKVTLTIPREAAVRLRQLAQNGSEALRQMGVLSVQVQGDSQIALTFLGSNNEHREVVLSSSPAPKIPSSSAAGSSNKQHVSNPPSGEAVVSLDDLTSSSGLSSDEVTRKNIVDYLRQGPHLRQNAALIGSLMGAVGAIATSSSPRLGLGQDVTTISNPDSSFMDVKAHSLRPNNIATVTNAAVHYQGSHGAKNVPFKTTGAFHSPVPQHSTSAGQSIAAIDSSLSSTSSHQLQQHVNDANLPTIQSTALRQLSNIAVSGTGQNNLASGISNFNSLGSLMHPSMQSSTSYASSSSYNYVDLPPPPPYPHGSNSTASPRTGKPGNASSPMLVNLLQTDPSVAAAGMAVGNPNKPLTLGEPNLSESPKKKRKKKKASIAKSVSNELVSSQNAIQRYSLISQTVNSHTDGEQTTKAADTHKALDIFNSRIDPSAASLPHYPPNQASRNDGLSTSGVQSVVRNSAIGARNISSMAIDSSRQLSQHQADAFLSETAAGKIINPYTGQLEPRDSIVDSGQPLMKDQGMSQGSTYSATQMLAQRAQELDEIVHKNVPHSSSAKLENVHVLQSVSSPILSLVSASNPTTTTAAASTVNSSELSQISRTKIPWLDSTSNVTTLSSKGSLSKPNAFPSSSHLCQTSMATVSSSANLPPIQSSSEPQCAFSKECSSEEAGVHRVLNGPLACGRDKEDRLREVQAEVNSKSHTLGAPSSSPEGMVLSNVRVCVHSVTSQATYSQAPQMEVPVSSLRNQIRVAPHSASPSLLPMSVSLDIPSSHHTRLSSSVTVAEQAKLSFQGCALSAHHRQAAASNADKVPFSTSVTSPSLLNSVLEKHIDSHSSTESPPEIKVLSEGDENSNHSGLVTESGAENSGSAALIEHSRVKMENHDSGVGSSSERSDDTPSEPGDSEFRANQPVTEAEDNNLKVSLAHKLVDCKTDPVFVSASNSITVGYMMHSSSENTHLSKSSAPLKNSVSAKRLNAVPVSGSSAETVGSDISQFYDAHCKSMEKQAGLLAVKQESLSSTWLAEKAVIDPHPSYGSRKKENGPTPSNALDNIANVKMNGPLPQGNINTMVMTMNELHSKKMRMSPKQAGVSSKGISDILKEEKQAKEAGVEKLNRIHYQLEDQNEPLSLSPLAAQEMKSEEGVIEESQHDASLPQRLERQAEQLFLDLEEMQAKIIGNGATVAAGGAGSSEGKGSNITSIYSKRSSPVNVNMLNHIYAPGLPLPRRLTESVQRLVKPLPASEMGVSMSLPQSRAYNSKSSSSPSVGVLPRLGATLSSSNGPHHPTRMTNHSGARSPGASMPRLIPNDQHQLLSGGLDLAGLSNLQMSSAYMTDSVSMGSISSHMSSISSGSVSGMREDILLKEDSHSLSVKLHSPPNFLRDSQSYSSKMLSQSYPPFKNKSHRHANVVQQNHDVRVNLDTPQSNAASHHSFFNSKRETASGPQEKINSQVSWHDNSLYNNHLIVDNKQLKVSNQPLSDETNHSNKQTDGLAPHRLSSSSLSLTSNIAHPNASSPLMPILQRGQEPPITPTLPSNIPSISSQPPLISLATMAEISPASQNDAADKFGTNLHAVPCSSKNQDKISSSDSKASVENAPDNTESSDKYAPPLPALSPIVSSPLSPMVSSADSFKPLASRSVDPFLGQPTSDKSTNDMCDPPKLTKAHPVTSEASVSVKGSSQGYQSNRNIFETVSTKSLPKESVQVATASMFEPTFEPTNHESNLNFSNDKVEKNDASQPVPNTFIDCVVEQGKEPVAKPRENLKNEYFESGSKQDLLREVCTDLENPNQSSFITLSKTLEISKIAKNSEMLSEIVKGSNMPLKQDSSPPLSQSVVESVLVTTVSTAAAELSSLKTSSTASFVSTSLQTSVASSSMSLTVEGSSTSALNPQLAAAVLPGSSPHISVNSASSAFKTLGGDTDKSIASTSTRGDSVGHTSGNVGGNEQAHLSPTSISSPVKEPILETLASALRQQHRSALQGRPDPQGKTPEKSPTYQRPPMVPLTASDISKLEQSMVLQGRMVAVSSSLQIKTNTSEKELVGEEAAESADTVGSQNRATRKRKLNFSDGEQPDVEESTAFSPTSQKHFVSGSSSKTKSQDTVLSKMEKANVKDSSSMGSGVGHTKTVFANSTEKGDSLKTAVESRDTAAKISADLEKSQERRRHRSITSSSHSDDGHSHRSSSNESRDSSHSIREGRANRAAAPERDGRTHHNSGNPSGEGLHREGRSHNKSYLGSEKDAQSKENRSNRVPGHHGSEGARHSHVDWSEDHFGDDKDKARSSGSKLFTATDKFSSPEGKDDGQKKAQRVKRQFYAYVPEKSLDQTYFDTPILSGRTRSKNKPSDEEAAGTATTSTVFGGLMSAAAPDTNTPSAVPLNAGSSAATAVAGYSAGQGKHGGEHGTSANSEAAGPGGKRPTRSVRTKDVSQEQTPNKRRKVQQHR